MQVPRSGLQQLRFLPSAGARPGRLLQALIDTAKVSMEMYTMPDPEWNELYIAEGKCSEGQRDTLQARRHAASWPLHECTATRGLSSGPLAQQCRRAHPAHFD
jgi:hypothetical protein